MSLKCYYCGVDEGCFHKPDCEMLDFRMKLMSDRWPEARDYERPFSD